MSDPKPHCRTCACTDSQLLSEQLVQLTDSLKGKRQHTVEYDTIMRDLRATVSQMYQVATRIPPNDMCAIVDVLVPGEKVELHSVDTFISMYHPPF